MEHRLRQADALPEPLGELADQLAGDVAEAAADADLLDPPVAVAGSMPRIAAANCRYSSTVMSR